MKFGGSLLKILSEIEVTTAQNDKIKIKDFKDLVSFTQKS